MRQSSFFEGWYFKHQCGKHTLAVIPGIHRDSYGRRAAFIQLITESRSHYVAYPYAAFRSQPDRLAVKIGHSVFTTQGCCLHIDAPGLSLHGHLSYGWITPLCGDIMGPFRYLPGMECRHGIVSLGHELHGEITLDGETISMEGGTGYIETDWGSSFPKRYLWTQCNTFSKPNTCIMAAAAAVPIGGAVMRGCMGVVFNEGVEHRLATYRGARVVCASDTRLEIQQGDWRLTAERLCAAPFRLYAPVAGGMTRPIHEHAACTVEYRFYRGEQLLLEQVSDSAGFEWV